MSSTARGGVREEDDFYETQPEDAREAIERMRPYVGKAPVLFEPMAGRGALVRLMREIWPESTIIANELNAGRAAQLRRAGADYVLVGDLFRPSLWEEVQGWLPQRPSSLLDLPLIDAAITNPAFRVTTQCVLTCRARIPQIKILQRTNFLHSQKRLGFWQQNPANIDLLPERPSFAASLTCVDHSLKSDIAPAAPNGSAKQYLPTDKGGKKTTWKRAACGWGRTQYLDDARPKTCPECGNPVRVSTSDSCEYMWAYFFDGATRTFHHLGAELPQQGLLAV